MTKKITRLLAITVCFLLVATALVACASASFYTVTFKANYEGGKDRSLQVEPNSTVQPFNSARSGYNLLGWYLDETLSQQFDFATPITADTVLYAKWQRKPENKTVTFNLMLEGEKDVQITVLEQQLIPQKDIPACSKLGFDYRGWYLDEDLTEQWDFDYDVVEDDMTLYAEYVPDLSIDRDANNNIVFNNVTVNLYANWVFDTADTYLADLIDSFNTEYYGKIRVVSYGGGLTTGSQDNYALRYQQIPESNKDYQNYYSAQSVYDLAGINFDKNDWYHNATRNCYVNGSLYSVPVVAGVPYIIYNPTLMAKYNGDNPLPTNYAQFSALIQKVYEGESKTSPDFKGMVTSNIWTFREATSMTAYIQNDAEYYVYEDGKYINKWGDNQSATYQRAITALTNTYNILGSSGLCHGGVSGDTYLDNLTRNMVVNGLAFMGIINAPGTSKDLWTYVALKKLGVMPLSGLFAGEGVTQGNQIPVHTIGFQFYKAKNVSVTELAAAAVFADYVSKNTISYAQNGWYPLNKTVTASDKFAKPFGDNYDTCQQIYWILKNVGNPEDFRTLDGYSEEKNIVNTIGGEQFMVTGGILAMRDGTVTDQYIADQIYKLQSTLLPLLD